MKAIVLTRELLEDLYVKQGLTQHQIAAQLDVSLGTVVRRVKKYDLKREGLPFTKELLEDLHIKQNKTQEQIAEQYGVSRRTIGNYLKQFGIEKSHDAVVESTRATFQKRYGVSHLLKDKEIQQERAKKRSATMLGEDYGREKINEMLKSRQIEMVDGYTKQKSKTLFRCLKDGCEWRTQVYDVLKGHGCPRCAGKEHYTQERFDAYLASNYPNVERTSEFKGVTVQTCFRCRACGYGATGEWLVKPCNFTVRGGKGHICPRCYRKEPYTTESFVAKLAQVNPHIRLVGEYNNKWIILECLIDGHRWRIKRPYEVIKDNNTTRTGCPACSRYYWDGNVYDSSWEILYHMDNPHLVRNTHRVYVYELNGIKRRWYPDFYDPITNLLHEVKPKKAFYFDKDKDAEAKIEAKRKLGMDVVWVGDAEIAAIRKKFPDFNAKLYRRKPVNHKYDEIENWKNEMAVLFPVEYQEIEFGRLYFPSHNLAVQFDTDYTLPIMTRRIRYDKSKQEGIRLIQIWKHEWLNSDRKDKIVRYLTKLLVPSTNVVLMARKMELRHLTQAEFASFADKHHLLGSCITKYRIGAFHNNELVAAHGYSKRGDVWELNRYVNGEFVIPGISNRLFARFRKDCDPECVISYVDLDKFEGNVDVSMGMSFEQDSEPTMAWVNIETFETLNRRTARTRHQKGMSYSVYVNAMLADKWVRVFDTGKRKMIWHK